MYVVSCTSHRIQRNDVYECDDAITITYNDHCAQFFCYISFSFISSHDVSKQLYSMHLFLDFNIFSFCRRCKTDNNYNFILNVWFPLPLLYHISPVVLYVIFVIDIYYKCKKIVAVHAEYTCMHVAKGCCISLVAHHFYIYSYTKTH